MVIIIDAGLARGYSVYTIKKGVFENGSTEKIKAKLGNCIEDFLNMSTKEEYHEKHKEFCEWFTGNIKTVEGKKMGRITKNSQYASWGEATKVIDNV